MDLKEFSAKYIAMLRALYLMHQNYHWVVNGSAFYSNHLLFERLYKSAQDNADLAAEKLIGNFSAEALDIENQPKFIQEYLSKHTDTSDIIKEALEAEKEFLEFSKEFYDFLDKEKKLSLGLDDAIMSIASVREEAVYLLKQIFGEKMSKLNDLAKKFQIKLGQVSKDPNQSVKPVEQLETPVPPPPKQDYDAAWQSIQQQMGEVKSPFVNKNKPQAQTPVKQPVIKPAPKAEEGMGGRDWTKRRQWQDPHDPLNPKIFEHIDPNIKQRLDTSLKDNSLKGRLLITPGTLADKSKVLNVKYDMVDGGDVEYIKKELSRIFPEYQVSVIGTDEEIPLNY